MDFKEVNSKQKYYKIIQTESEYRDGRNFPIDEIVIADKKVNLHAATPEEMGGFCISDSISIFRWIIRGDTLCEVIIPEDTILYKTESKNGIYIADKMILTNPIKLDEKKAMALYEASDLPEESYFRSLAVCSIKGYSRIVERIISDKVNKLNIDRAIEEYEAFCHRREEEYKIDTFSIELVKNTLNSLKKIKDE